MNQFRWRSGGAERVAQLGFAEMMRQLIEVGGDTDTIAAMAGNVAGALIGYESLPRDISAVIPDAEIVMTAARRLAELVTAG